MTHEIGQEQAGASIHFLRPQVRRPDASDIHFALRIDNFQHIMRAYGPNVAMAALAEIHRILNSLLCGGGLATQNPDGRLYLVVWDRELFDGGPLHLACSNWLGSMCSTLALVPLECEDSWVQISLSGAWTPHSLHEELEDWFAGGAASALERIRFAGDPSGYDETWARRYRDDMSRAVELFGALATDKMLLEWQPVRHAENSSETMYHECLLHEASINQRNQSSEAIATVLERLGFARAFDHYIVTRVIDELECDPDVRLGVKISAQSAILDNWWNDIVERLQLDSSIAKRLILEISETSSFPSISDSVTFASHMRRLGCQIALDNFGTGFASIRQLLALRPNIVKLDRLFVDHGSIDGVYRDTFEHLAGLAKTMAPLVIAKGIDREDQSVHARETGVIWQQGRFLGTPSIVRPWQAGGNGKQPGVSAHLDGLSSRVDSNLKSRGGRT